MFPEKILLWFVEICHTVLVCSKNILNVIIIIVTIVNVKLDCTAHTTFQFLILKKNVALKF